MQESQLSIFESNVLSRKKTLADVKMVLTDEDIKRLYQDPKFLGSFSGAVNLRQFLYTDYGEVRQPSCN